MLLSALIGNEVVDERGGVRVVQFLAPGMAAFGVVMATFSFLSIGLAEARSTGVVKRQSGAPVPRWVLIGGRMGAALLLGLTSTALVLAAGVAFYDLQVPEPVGARDPDDVGAAPRPASVPSGWPWPWPCRRCS